MKQNTINKSLLQVTDHMINSHEGQFDRLKTSDATDNAKAYNRFVEVLKFNEASAKIKLEAFRTELLRGDYD